MNYGATNEDWAHFEIVLGLGQELLPTVCDPSVAPSPRSAIKEHGRTPSLINRDGHMAGIKDWPKYVTNGEIRRWSADARLGICMQTRLVRGIDIDVPDPAIAEYIAGAVNRILGVKLPTRRRENTGKRLLAVIVKGDIPKKRLAVDGGMVEFLGTGQMFVAAGVRKDGSRYYWEDGLPNDIPEISLEQYDSLIEQLAREVAIEPLKEASTASRQRGEHLDVEDPVADWLEAEGLSLGETGTGAIKVACPWSEEHTSGEDGDSSTVWFRAGTNGHSTGHFKCMHAHCEGRNRSDFLRAAGYEEDLAADFEDLGPDPEAGKDDNSEGDLSSFSTPLTRNPFKLLTVREFLDRPRPGWIIKGLMPMADLGVVYGASGAGKSFIMLDLVMAIARGIPWRGLRVKQGKVVYICAEGAGGFRNRVEAYCQHHGIDGGSLPLLILDAVPNLLDAKQVKALAETIEAEPDVALIVCDTFAQMTPGANENAGEDMGKAISHVRHVGRKVKATVVLVHHSGKDAAKGARGWSGIRAAADFEMEVTRDGEDRALNTTKQKDADDQASWGFKLQEMIIALDEDDDPIRSAVVVESDVAVEAGVNGGKRKAKPEKKLGEWEQAILDVHAELSVGGDVLKTELILRAAERRPDKGTLRDRKKNVGHALKGLRQGKDSIVLPHRAEDGDDKYVVLRS